MFGFDLSKPNDCLVKTQRELSTLERDKELFQVIPESQLDYIVDIEEPQLNLVIEIEIAQKNLSPKFKTSTVLTDHLHGYFGIFGQVLSDQAVENRFLIKHHFYEARLQMAT